MRIHQTHWKNGILSIFAGIWLYNRCWLYHRDAIQLLENKADSTKQWRKWTSSIVVYPSLPNKNYSLINSNLFLLVIGIFILNIIFSLRYIHSILLQSHFNYICDFFEDMAIVKLSGFSLRGLKKKTFKGFNTKTNDSYRVHIFHTDNTKPMNHHEIITSCFVWLRNSKLVPHTMWINNIEWAFEKSTSEESFCFETSFICFYCIHLQEHW